MTNSLRLSTETNLKSRYFNQIVDKGIYYEKRSTRREKLLNEFNFLNSIPGQISIFFPKVHNFQIREEYNSYLINKISVRDASHLLLSNSLPENDILNLLQKVKEYLDLCPEKTCSDDDFIKISNREIINKNDIRFHEIRELHIYETLNRHCRSFGYKSLEGYVFDLNKKILNKLKDESHDRLYFTHGDLCFSNILLDGDQLFLIDPKGADTYDQNFRPIHYDLAKLSQSLLGHYDLINNNFFSLNNDNLQLPEQKKNAAKEYFMEMVSHYGSSYECIRLIEASLFFSLIPFHLDSKLKSEAFILNSLNIASEFK